MIHKACSSIDEVPYWFSRSSVKFQVHMRQMIYNFDLNWGFPDCNSSLNSLMAFKKCTVLDIAQNRCPIGLRGHPLNLKLICPKNRWFESNLSNIKRLVIAIKSLRFALFHLIPYWMRRGCWGWWWLLLMGKSRVRLQFLSLSQFHIEYTCNGRRGILVIDVVTTYIEGFHN